MVICEEGEELSEVIAANYAFSLRAGLALIPRVAKAEADELLERLYSLYDSQDDECSQTERLDVLRQRLRELCGDIAIPQNGSVTFISRELPFGFALQEAPSTHLFTYPDLGIAIVNGFAAEQPNSRVTNVIALVDPQKAEAPEIEVTAKLLAERGAFIRGYSGAGASVRRIGEVVELFPYDVLMFATHCGDAPGSRETFEFEDSEGIRRSLVVNIAVGFALADEDDMVEVTQFMHFHSLDGVDWNDPNKEERIHIGTAISDFTQLFREGIQPVSRQQISRVPGSAALEMHDGVYIAMPQTIAALKSPIVVNNACASWHELAMRFTYGGARAYLGTLFPILAPEAHEVTLGLFGVHYGKPLAHALWSAQNSTFGDSSRRPYVATGVYPQRFRVAREDVPHHLTHHMASVLPSLRRDIERLAANGNEFGSRKTQEAVEYYELELAWFRNRAR